MNSTDSLTEFFYNIVPGSLFVLTLCYFLDIHISALIAFSGHNESDNGAVVIFLILILGLFFGFIFQGMTKWIRSQSFRGKSLGGIVFQDIVTKDCLSFKIAVELFLATRLLKLSEIKSLKKKKNEVGIEDISVAIMKSPIYLRRMFYLMDNYLRGIGGANAIQHFTARLAFWSNVYFGALCLIAVIIFMGLRNNSFTRLQWWDIIVLLPIFYFAANLFRKYLFILYDSVLKTFVTVLLLENKTLSSTIFQNSEISQ